MKPKEYLSQAQRLKRRYETAIEELDTIRSMAGNVGAIRYDKDIVQSSPKNDQLVEYMIRLEKAEDRAMKASEAFFTAYQTIKMQIETVAPQLYSDVLYMRYIQGKSIWEIATALNYSYGWIKHVHGLALVEFGRMFPEAMKDSTKKHL